MEPLDEDWDAMLAIVAHPDDLEYGASSAVARWRAQGKRVSYVIVTDGESGIDGLPPHVAGPRRRQEQLLASRAVGVDHVEFLGYPDGRIEYSLDLRRDLARCIRRNRPNLLMTATHHLTFGDRQLNQPDHRHVALAVMDAAKDAGNRWIHPDLTEEGFDPFGGVEGVLLMGSSEPTHAVDVSSHLEQGIASLRAHKSYLDGLGRDFDPDEFLREMTAVAGRHLGVSHGVAFEVLSNIGV
jgi:LmbE family N-acetylglucosaminyl deacetylase